MATPAKKPKASVIIIAGVLALSLVVGGAWAAFTFFFRGATIVAARSLPADVTGVIEVNLNPSGEQQLAVSEWIKRFPSIEANVTADSYKQGLYELFADSMPDAPGWEKAEPWLGDSFAFATIDGDPGWASLPLLSVAVKDKIKALAYFEEHIASESDYLQMIFVDDTMLIWDSYYRYTPNEEDIKRDPLANDETYKRLMSGLPGNGLVTFYATSQATEQLLRAPFGGYSDTSTGLEDFLMAGALTAGNDVLTVESAMIQEMSFGSDWPDVTPFVGDMSANSVAVIGAGIDTATYDEAWKRAIRSGEDDQLETYGITSADDMKALFGDQLSLALCGSPQSPEVGYKARGADESKIEALASKLSSNGEVEVTSDGDTTWAAYGQDPSDVQSPSSKLKDLDAYKKAVPGTGHQAIIWINVNRLPRWMGAETSSLPDVARDALKAISGIGYTSRGDSDGYSQSTLRVVAN